MPTPVVRLVVCLLCILGLFGTALADGGAPRIVSTPLTQGVVGELYSYNVEATGSTPIIYNLAQFPVGMQINPNNGLIQWSPSEAGVFNVTVQALNSYGSYVQRFSVTVTPALEASVIKSAAITNGLTDEQYLYDVDASGYPLPIYKLTQAPSGMTIVAATGRIDWLTSIPGSYPISIRVENSQGFDTQSFILNMYQFPQILSDPDTTGTVDNLYQYDVDALGSPVLVYSLLEWPNGMSINGSTGLIEWTPDSAGVFDVSVEVSNPAGAVTQEYLLYVESVYDPPVIVSNPVVAGTVGNLYQYDVDATGDPEPIYKLASPPAGMTIDTLTGLIQWTPTVDGDYDISVTATNIAGSRLQQFTISIEKAPAPPEITSFPILQGTTNDFYTYQVHAIGYPDPHFSLLISPSGMTIDSLTGLIGWTPSAGGNFDVTVVATNANGTDFQSFTIHTESPQAPQIISIPITSVGAGQMYSYNVNASGYPAPFFSLDDAPATMTIDSLTGAIHWNPLTPGDVDVTIRATNSVGTYTQSFLLSVIEAYQAPSIVTTPPTEAELDLIYQYDVNATGYPIPTFHLNQGPAGMTIDTLTGLIDWLPDAFGAWDVEVIALNSVGSSVQDFRVSTSCCGNYTSGFTGNVDCDVEGKRNLADITRLIDRVYISKNPLCCETNGNVDGDSDDKINLADITRLIDHVYISRNQTASCN